MASLTFIEISGSPQEVGRALGYFGVNMVRQHLLHTSAWQSVMRWRGSQIANTMAMLVRARFPRVWAILQGLAEGLCLPLEDIFLWNCRADVGSLSSDGCTTLQLPSPTLQQIAHNEDGDPGLAGHCALVQCHIKGSPSFTTFIYPGSLPGHTFAVTDAGLAICVNNLRQRDGGVGIPRMFLMAAVLEASNLDAAVSILRDHPRAGSFHVTLGHCAGPGLLSVEYNSYRCSVRQVIEPAIHTNHAIHSAMQGFSQTITDSSFYRQTRGEAMLAQARLAGQSPDPLAILADQANTAFPIYRNHLHDSDNENTLASTCMTIHSTHIEWKVYEHPGDFARYRLINSHRQKEYDLALFSRT